MASHQNPVEATDLALILERDLAHPPTPSDVMGYKASERDFLTPTAIHNIDSANHSQLSTYLINQNARDISAFPVSTNQDQSRTYHSNSGDDLSVPPEALGTAVNSTPAVENNPERSLSANQSEEDISPAYRSAEHTLTASQSAELTLTIKLETDSQISDDCR